MGLKMNNGVKISPLLIYLAANPIRD